MKRSTTFFTLLGLVVMLANAGVGQVPVRLGIKGGINVANASFDPDVPAGISKSARTAFTGGGMIDIGLSDMWYLQGEPRFTQKGFEVEGDLFENGTSAKARWKVDFIEIPLALKAKLGTEKVRPYLFAGPNIGFKVSADAQLEAAGASLTVDIDSTVESVDFAIDFGGGVEIEVTRNVAIAGDARYSLGLTDLDKSADPQSVKSTGIQIILGILFKLGN